MLVLLPSSYMGSLPCGTYPAAVLHMRQPSLILLFRKMVDYFVSTRASCFVLVLVAI